MDHLKILPQPLTGRNFTKLHLKDDDDDGDDDDDDDDDYDDDDLP